MNSKLFLFIFSLFIILSTDIDAQTNKFRYDINNVNVELNELTVEVVNDSRLSNNKGVRLRPRVSSAIDGERGDPDVTFHIKSPSPKKYIMRSYAVVDSIQDSIFAQTTSKFNSLYLKIQFDHYRPIKRVVAVPWNRPLQTIGVFELSGKSQKLKIWLPKGVHLEYLEFTEYVPPKTPSGLADYKPQYIPPNNHPRLWVTEKTLPSVRKKLKIGENAEIWKSLKTRAKKPFSIDFDTTQEISGNKKLERTALEKAFYFLMAGDEKIGSEAVNLINSYLPFVEYGNILDATRDIGETIYTSSLVYDWCYPLLSTSQKEIWIKKLLHLAEQMEIGWLPFRQTIVNGHGNEAQLSRDLLSMSIAIYNEEPSAYQYCSYRVLEELVPMKQFEYQSSRHPQGVNYGDFRIRWDLHAAWLYKRMIGKEVFDPNIKDVFKFWTYMRTPDGQMLRDGDGFNAPAPGKSIYWQRPITRFLAYTYAGDAVEKAEFIRQGDKDKIAPYLFLLLNEPTLKPDFTYRYPLTHDFGDITGGMIARTGWDSPDDVIVEIKGGGYRNGAHQHADAGSIQLYYRGFLLGDIGMYNFAGTDYDVNFNRRSISHSTMLVHDPTEDFGREYGRKAYNDWGQRYNAPHPVSPEHAKENPTFKNGEVLSASFGPSETSPVFSYFSVDLTPTYSNKVEDYVRSFCFINTGRKDIPGIIILTDHINTASASFAKHLQINSLKVPEETNTGLILYSESSIRTKGKAYMDVLLPKERITQVLSERDAFTVDGVYFEPPPLNIAERTGNRTIISPKIPLKKDHFLTVFQIAEEDASPLPINFKETDNSYIVNIDQKIIVMSNSKRLINNEVSVAIPLGKICQLAIVGLEKGNWIIKNDDNSIIHMQQVGNRNNSLFIEALTPGNYIISRE